MLKYFVLIINSLFLFLYNIFAGDDVKITAKFPENVKPASEYTAEVSLKKGAVSGFAKLQLDIPAGFAVKELESKGGAFTFENQSLKYIWTALPADDEIIVKFKLIIDADVVGEKLVAGKFSYITNNVKQQLNIEPIKITVEGASTPAVAAEPVVKPVIDSTIKSATAPVKDSVATLAASVPPAPNATKPLTGNEPSSTEVSCARTISQGTKSGQYKIQIAINKLDIKGFAKLVEILPPNTKASAIKTSGSSFSMVDNKAKFVWVSVPKEKQLLIEYEVTFNPSVDPKVTLDGEFSYLENDLSKKVKIDGDQLINVSFAPVVAVNTSTNDKPNDTKNIEPAASSTSTTNNTDAGKTTNPENTSVSNVANNTNNSTVNIDSTKNVTTPDNTTAAKTEKKSTTGKTTKPTEPSFTSTNNVTPGNVNYSIQIGAYKSTYNPQYYVKKYGITETIRTDMHEGYTKCIIGNFNEYKPARDQREVMKGKGISGAFVTAYNTGKRITVQEALMISNQKWFK